MRDHDEQWLANHGCHYIFDDNRINPFQPIAVHKIYSACSFNQWELFMMSWSIPTNQICRHNLCEKFAYSFFRWHGAPWFMWKPVGCIVSLELITLTNDNASYIFAMSVGHICLKGCVHHGYYCTRIHNHRYVWLTIYSFSWYDQSQTSAHWPIRLLNTSNGCKTGCDIAFVPLTMVTTIGRQTSEMWLIQTELQRHCFFLFSVT